jgi:hypothetical protein
VVARLGRELTADELAAVPGLITEATALVVGHLARDWDALADVPAAVRVVCSRIVSRTLTGTSNLPAGTEQFGSSMGPFGQTTRLGADVVTGSVWLSKSDKTTLSPYFRRGQIVNVAMYHVIE